jgi:hypothetical protein
MEPPVRFELTTSAILRRRSVRWSYRGSVPGAGLEPACADFKDRPGCQQPTPEWSRLPVPTRVSCLTGAGSQPCATAGTGASEGGRFRFTDQRESPCSRRCWVSSAGVGPALSATSTLRLLPNWATRTWSRHPVPTRAIRRTRTEPQPCGAARAGESGFEPELNGPEPIVLPGLHHSPLSAGGEIRTPKRPGLSRPGVPSSHHTRRVRRQGVDPRSPR